MSGNIVVRDPENEDNVWWEVEKIVDRRRRKGEKQYLVRWAGCSEDQDTWEPQENLCDSLYELAKKYDEEHVETRKRKSSAGSSSRKKQSRSPVNRDSWTMSDGEGSGLSLLSLGHLSINTLCHRPSPPLTFASYYFGKRIVGVEVPLKRGVDVPPTNAVFGGYALQLLSSRIPRESRAGKNLSMGIQKSIRLTYVATSGPDIAEINLQETLESIADFKSLTPHKAKARLELLDSGTNEGTLITDLKTSDFQVVKEDNHLGCGFIPESILTRILGEKSSSQGPKCIQVRVISPQLGIFKGVLCPKRGIDCIELPHSMRKVKPSRATNREEWVCLIVKNLFPTAKNVQIGRSLSLDSESPSLSYFHKRERAPGEMIERLWQSLGVERKTIVAYTKRANKKGTIAGLKHSYLLGVADPTGELPKGLVFLPGMGSEHGKLDKVFITRSPCVEPCDGRLVRVVKSKPRGMSSENWDFINRLPFGIVVFGPPRGQDTPLPELIAGGDLDGDGYLVCWDADIVSNIEAVRPARFASECEIVSGPAGDASTDEGWLSASQEVMLDVEWWVDNSQVHGKLWSLAKREADNSSLFMNDPTAIQFARAYKQSLDLAKQGGRLSVPKKIYDALPQTLRGILLTQTKTSREEDIPS